MTISAISAEPIATVARSTDQTATAKSAASSSPAQNTSILQKKSEDASVTRLRVAAEEYLKTLNLINQISKNAQSNEANDIFEAFGISTSPSETERGLNNAAGELAQKVVNGTDGSDFIRRVEGRSVVNAGAGNDIINAYGQSRIDAGAGDDIVNSYGQSIIDGGSGRDIISAYGQSQVHGGSGRDSIRTYGQSQVHGGSGDDVISTQGQSIVNGGSGNDNISVHGQATVNGGSGKDRISTNGSDVTLIFDKGDGTDHVHLNGNNVTLEVGPGFSKDDLEFIADSRGQKISFKGSEDKIYFSVTEDSDVTVKFSDGESVGVHIDADFTGNVIKLAPGAIQHLGTPQISRAFDKIV